MMHALRSLPRKGQQFVFKESDIVHTAWPNMKVYASPQLIADIVCVLLSRVYLRVNEVLKRSDKSGKTITWVRADCGWLLATDGGETPFLLLINNIEEAETSWAQEEAKKQRIASAVASMLVRSYSLPRCIRLARSIMKHAVTYYPDTNLTKISDEIMENIMIILGGQTALTKQKVFEYIKAAAARQSNPKKAVIDISQIIFDTICKRPTLWVKEDLNVIVTEEAQRRYDQFVMAAAMGDVETFQQFLNINQELTSLHSQLHYTALHAAAEFGKVEIINMLRGTGLSLDIRDPVRGQTALHFAGYAGRSEVALALLEAGANRQILCYSDIYPFQAAEKQGHVECREILKFLPPVMTTLTIVDVTINSISLQWDMPVLNRQFYAKIREYQVICQCTEELHPDTQKSIPDPLPILTPSLSCVFKNLISACGYRCRIRCRSVSGWSDWSEWVSITTHAYIPDTPASPEIRKVTINALYLNWYKPIRSNGADVDYYEIELRDHQSITAIEQQTALLLARHHQGTTDASERTDPTTNQLTPLIIAPATNNDPETSISPPTSPSTRSPGSRKKSDSLVAQQGGVSKMHRVVKHKDVMHLYKYLTGLEPGRPYRVRIRAHNAMGFSGWSKWSPPVAPQVGVTISAFINESKSVALQWFEPILSEQHSIECYELQLCKVIAPRSVHLHAQQYHELHHPEVFEDPSLKLKTMVDEDDEYFDDEYTLARKREAAAEAAKKQKEIEQKIQETKEKAKQLAATLHLTRDGAEAVEEGGMNEDFHTIANDIRTNRFTLSHLKAGGRYVVRVRIKLVEESHWMAWDHALRSETFATPPSIPDPPMGVQPRRRLHRPKKEELRPMSPENRQSRALLQQHSLMMMSGDVPDGVEDIFPSAPSASSLKTPTNPKKPPKGKNVTLETTSGHIQPPVMMTATNYSGYVDQDILLSHKRQRQNDRMYGVGGRSDDSSAGPNEDDRSLSWWQSQIEANEATIAVSESQLASNKSSSDLLGQTTLGTTHRTSGVLSSSSASSLHTSLASVVPDAPNLRKPNQHEPLPLSFYHHPHYPSARDNQRMEQQQHQQHYITQPIPTQPYDDNLVLPQEDAESQHSTFLMMHPAKDPGDHAHTFDMAEFMAMASVSATSLTATLPYEREDSFLHGGDSQDNSLFSPTIMQRQPMRNGLPTFEFTAPGITAQEELETQSLVTGEPMAEDAPQLFTDLWEITHDTITITWTPGDSNGENLTDCELQMAEIKTYNHQDVLCARDAFLGLHYDEERQEQLLHWTMASSDSLEDGHQRTTKTGTGGDLMRVDDMVGLQWERINDRGRFLSPSAFQVQSLLPGGVYSFRIRIGNRIGWSPWSKASAMIATYPSVAPRPPQIVYVKATFSVVLWEEVQYKQNQLTTLENQLQICTVAQQRAAKVAPPPPQSSSSQFDYSETAPVDTGDASSSGEGGGDDEHDADWRLVSTSRPLGKKEIEAFLGFDAPLYAGKNVSGAMIERLVEGRFYKVRVRVRTVVGWSPWSESSDLFRTMS